MTEEQIRPSYTQLAQEVLHQLGRIEGKLDAFDARLRVVEGQSIASQQRAEFYIPMFEKLKVDTYAIRDEVVILRQEALTSKDKAKARIAIAAVLVGVFGNFVINAIQGGWRL